MSEPLRDVREVIFHLWPDANFRVGPACPVAVAHITRVGPHIEVIARCRPVDFEYLWAIAVTGYPLRLAVRIVDLVADDEGDDLTDEERRALHEALSESWNSAEAGRLRPVSVILDELRLTLVSPPVRTTLEADAQIGEIDDWWRENRLCSPEFFFEEHVLELVLGRGVL